MFDKKVVTFVRLELMRRISDMKTYSWVNLMYLLRKEYGWSEGLVYANLQNLCKWGYLIKTQSLISRRKTWFSITNKGEEQLKLIVDWMKGFSEREGG